MGRKKNRSKTNKQQPLNGETQSKDTLVIDTVQKETITSNPPKVVEDIPPPVEFKSIQPHQDSTVVSNGSSSEEIFHPIPKRVEIAQVLSVEEADKIVSTEIHAKKQDKVVANGKMVEKEMEAVVQEGEIKLEATTNKEMEKEGQFENEKSQEKEEQFNNEKAKVNPTTNLSNEKSVATKSGLSNENQNLPPIGHPNFRMVDVKTETRSPFRMTTNHHYVALHQSEDESSPLTIDVGRYAQGCPGSYGTQGTDVYRRWSGQLDISPRLAQFSKADKVWWLTVISLVANLILFSSKIYISIESRSLAVMASAVDSLLDLVSQLIIFFALRNSKLVDQEKWPVGRSRLEPVGIIICASLMGMASLQLVYESIQTIVLGSLNIEDRKVPAMEKHTIILLVCAIAIKAFLFAICHTMSKESQSVMVLAEDHRNDVLSNSMALLGAFLAFQFPIIWWIDAAGAILISVYICAVWIEVAKEQTAMLVGRSAEPAFLTQVTEMANDHHDILFVDIVRAYHFGKRYLVELEVVLPETMSVAEAHDIALSLQKRVERLREVERAFVHVDYMQRDENEHKVAGIITPPHSPTPDQMIL